MGERVTKTETPLEYTLRTRKWIRSRHPLFSGEPIDWGKVTDNLPKSHPVARKRSVGADGKERWEFVYWEDFYRSPAKAWDYREARFGRMR